MLIVGTDVSATMGNIFRNASLFQTRQFSGCETLELAEMDNHFVLGQVVARQTSLIVISGAEMSVLFKMHFNISEGDRLRRMKFHDQSLDQAVATAKTLDYMKELTNQVCGRISRVLHRNGLVLGMCIPLSMRGFYELYADYTTSEGMLKKFGLAWRIKGDFGSFVCTAYVEIADQKSVNNLQFVDEQLSNDNGELEFL